MNFIAEMTLVPKVFEPSTEKWQVWVDGACGVESARMSIVLQGLESI